MRNWCIKDGKTMHVLRTIIKGELLEYIREVATPKVTLGTLETLFSKKKDV